LTVYQSSTGPKVIAEMNFHNLSAAVAKLRREADLTREDELMAMTIRLAEMQLNPPDDTRGIGDNDPPAEALAPKPAPSTLAEHAEHIGLLDAEARNWADGQAIETPEQAAEVDRLIVLIKAAINGAEATRDAEKEPFAEKVKAIQTAYQPLIADKLKSAPDGVAVRGLKALLAVKTKWGAELTRRREVEAARLRTDAFAAAAKARETLATAADDIGATEAAETFIKAAQGDLRAARTLDKPVTGGFRDNWIVEGFDDRNGDGRVILMRHYFQTNPAALVDFCLGLARTDIRSGLRNIPGLVIKNDRKAF
jgi:hypothetical protein